jgi:hypothetical protein
VLTGFLTQAKAIAKAMGAKNIALAEYPGIVNMDSKEELHRKVADVVVKNIVAGFTNQVQETVKSIEPSPRDIVFRGSLDEVQEHFYKNAWTDGLPVIPPTLKRVNDFLKFTATLAKSSGHCSPKTVKRRFGMWRLTA